MRGGGEIALSIECTTAFRVRLSTPTGAATARICALSPIDSVFEAIIAQKVSSREDAQ